MGNEYASTEELSKAIKIAQLEELVDTLPDGLTALLLKAVLIIQGPETADMYCSSVDQTSRDLCIR